MITTRIYQCYHDKLNEELNAIHVLYEGTKLLAKQKPNISNDNRNIFTARARANKQAYISIYSYTIDYFVSIFKALLIQTQISEEVNAIINKLGKITLQFDNTETISLLNQQTDIKELVVQKLTNLFKRKVEEKDKGKTLIKDFIKIFDLNIELTQVELFMEMRHLFIHNNGKPDKKFKESYNVFTQKNTIEHISFKGDITKFIKNQKLPTDYEKLIIAIEHYRKFIQEIDTQLVSRFEVFMNPVLYKGTISSKKTPTEAGV